MGNYKSIFLSMSMLLLAGCGSAGGGAGAGLINGAAAFAGEQFSGGTSGSGESENLYAFLGGSGEGAAGEGEILSPNPGVLHNPEPASLALFGTGFGLAALRRRRKDRAVRA